MRESERQRERDRETDRERNKQAHTDKQTHAHACTHTRTCTCTYLEEAFDGKGLNQVVKDMKTVVVTALNAQPHMQQLHMQGLTTAAVKPSPCPGEIPVSLAKIEIEVSVV